MLLDKDIREPLFNFLEEKYGKVRILEEKVIGKSRADVLMVCEDGLCGLEIKSDSDNYSRLKTQVKDYDSFYDRNYAVVGTSHALHISEHIPDTWGIIVVEKVDDKLDFYLQREAQINPNKDLKKELSLLWRRELVHIQEINNLPAYAQKSKAFVREKILEKVDHDLLLKQICQELFERDYTTIKEDIDNYRRSKGRRARRKIPKRR